MVIISTSLHQIFHSGVMPIPMPTVPMAENTSKRIKWKECPLWSKISSKNTAIVTQDMASRNTAKLLLIILASKRRLNSTTSFLSRKRAMVDATSTAKVVVLTPPPVEVGDAPINIMSIIKNMVGWVKEAKSTVLKPAVRKETDWNMEASHCCPKGACPMV